MLVLGFSGGPSRVCEEDPSAFTSPLGAVLGHDSAAVLIESGSTADGRVIAGVEEERLVRIKHANKFPFTALRAVLAEAQVSLMDVDRVAFYFGEAYMDEILKRGALAGSPGVTSIRQAVNYLLNAEFGVDFPANRLQFVNHHLAHAASAYYPSGFDRSLVVTLDGRGEGDCGVVMQGARGALEFRSRFDADTMSLGDFYTSLIGFLGYRMFDEYKVMGLAPYGDPARFRPKLRELYSLLPEGMWTIDFQRLWTLHDVLTPRRRDEPITQVHQDFAASLQEALEAIALHCLSHWQRVTGESHLCLAGGVAHNCTMNGKILRSGLFERVFVQPAAHDGGCAYGAALAVSAREQGVRTPGEPRPALTQLYWGPRVVEGAIEQELARWSAFIRYEKVENVAEQAAELMAQGAVIGWFQGRSEFGPRALGNRSILADPRPAENKDRINAMIKKREGFRPFAPAVLEEYAAEYFELAGAAAFPFMIFVLGVKPEKRALLGAVTHVDGSARVQTVSRAGNAPFWSVIDEFRKLTGCPILLNTSFNNNAEPIVETPFDALVCYLTTQLDYLVAGDYVVRRRPEAQWPILELCADLPPYVRTQRTRTTLPDGRKELVYGLTHTGLPGARFEIPREVWELLDRVDGRTRLAELWPRSASRDEVVGSAPIWRELRELWSRRLIRLEPANRSPQHG